MNFIFIKDKIETLDFFSVRLADALSERGFDVYIHGFYGDRAPLLSRIKNGGAVLITFNCIGVSGEAEYMTGGMSDDTDNSAGGTSDDTDNSAGGTSLWSLYGVTVVNILVDHPMYYHEQLQKLAVYAASPERTHIVCIDRFHLQYVRNFYPEAVKTHFMVLAGSGSEYAVDHKDKKYDIIFTGNFTPCSRFDCFIEANGPEYAAFYRGIIDDLLSDVSRPVEQVCVEHIRREAPEATPAELRFTLSKFLFIDLYVRFYFREKAIAALADGGFNLKLVGSGFEKIRTKKGIALSGGTLLPTALCLKETALAKISLNVMPRFCDGGHDRILSSMLCGSLSLTDSSVWLRENFTDGQDLRFYDITAAEKLPELAAGLLDDPGELRAIAENGRKKALESHTWDSRADEILGFLVF